MVGDTYISENEPEDKGWRDASHIVNLVFTFIFVLESLLKMVAFGFCVDKNSYLRDTWSILDFFIVSVSMIDIFGGDTDFSIFRIMRMLRTLRPLRFISHNLSMKLVVTALLESVSGILNVLLVVILIWMMFGILGMNLMRGRMNYC